MSEDRTYCIRECSCLKCDRNKKHIKMHNILHSFMDLEHTKDCKKEGKKC